MSDKFTVDRIHYDLGPVVAEGLPQYVWKDKYRHKEETSGGTYRRVASAIMCDESTRHLEDANGAMLNGLFMPGGRIIAGAGTGRLVTLMNCYVMQTIPDSMEGIADILKDSMITLKQGGGIGLDFSTLRPHGADLVNTGGFAAGPLAFADIWDAACKALRSAGYRRGAMMITMRCDHPDIEAFIKAKREQGRLTNFNMSVLVTDVFMKAVKDDQPWNLVHKVHPEGKKIGKAFLAKYKTMSARYLWNLIMENTYEYAEPGVIFIDRVNETNNLSYCETIAATNPCGEQPLPPYGACDLGAINLARLVLNPFTEHASFDFVRLNNTVKIAVRFLDNVLDKTNYPLEEQREEGLNKRRIGLGVSGLADCFHQLRVSYGSDESVEWTTAIMRNIAMHAYSTSIELAKEKGPFPAYDQESFMGAPFIENLTPETRMELREHGIRNGLLLTCAPTGTSSLLYGDISSGIEPVFAYKMKRNVLNDDGSYDEFQSVNYGVRLWEFMYPGESLPAYFRESSEISPMGHLKIQAACQEWVDASISKTINCPEDISYEEFKQVYTYAYDMGCKGCTTYRPSDVRGAILTKDEDNPADSPSPEEADEEVVATNKPIPEGMEPRPKVLQGHTYKVKWPNLENSLYLTINNLDGRPYEVFISSVSANYAEWMTALTRMISAIMRRQSDIKFIGEELKQVASAHDSAWVEGKFYKSIVAMIGQVIELHINREKDPQEQTYTEVIAKIKDKPDWSGTTVQVGLATEIPKGSFCPKCSAPSLVHQEGCDTCLSCGFSNCN